MQHYFNKHALIFFLLFTVGLSFADNNNEESVYSFSAEQDPCLFDEAEAMRTLQILGEGWGYNYDSLMADLGRWSNSPFVKLDSIGSSVQQRTLWLLTITDSLIADSNKIRVTIHSRTHPAEVQSSWVTNEIIKLLLSDDEIGILLRRKCIFNIVPMYNPGGVELGYPRENANGLDLERNWDKNPHEPETAALKKLYESFMASENPTRVALNMHSAGTICKRYFVCHGAGGTSDAFLEDEINFIEGIRAYWPEGIEPWNYYISWAETTPHIFLKAGSGSISESRLWH